MASSGKCLCGAVRFEADGVEFEHHACHCEKCRRWSGGSPFFGANARSVHFMGAENIGRYSSSDWAERGFCKACGSALFYYLRPTQAYIMSVGTFDDQSRFKLVREIFIESKPAGYEFAGDHPRWTEAEAFERLSVPQE